MESLHYLLMKSHSILNRRIINEASELGLSAGQPKILEYLLQYGENNQKTIAEYCEIEQATAGSILLRMETAGLIVRKKRQGNRRSLYVDLTSTGKTAAEKMEQIFKRQEESASKALTETEKQQLRFLLQKFCQSAMEETEGGNQL